MRCGHCVRAAWLGLAAFVSGSPKIWGLFFMDTYRRNGRKLECRGKKRLHPGLGKKLCKTRSRIIFRNIFLWAGSGAVAQRLAVCPVRQWFGANRPAKSIYSAEAKKAGAACAADCAVAGALGLQGEIAYKIRLRHTAAFGRGCTLFLRGKHAQAHNPRHQTGRAFHWRRRTCDGAEHDQYRYP